MHDNIRSQWCGALPVLSVAHRSSAICMQVWAYRWLYIPTPDLHLLPYEHLSRSGPTANVQHLRGRPMNMNI